MLEAAVDLVALLDDDGRPVWANPAAQVVLGLLPTLDLTFAQLVAPGSGDAWDGARRCLDEKRLWVGSLELVPLAGATLPVSVVAVRLDGGDGARTGVICRDRSVEVHLQDEQDARRSVDPLTGVMRRERILAEIDDEVERWRPGAPRPCLLFVDLDGFKGVNDELGHEAGDMVLVQATRRIKAKIREVDSIGRLGGDEFVALLRDTKDTLDPVGVGHRIVDAVSVPLEVAGHQVEIGASVGLAAVEGEELEPGELLRRADVAMYEAKRRGRSQVVVYDDELAEMERSTQRMRAALRQSLANDELEIVHRPVIALGTRELCGLEASLVWHGALGRLPLSRWIDLAVDTGVIAEMQVWAVSDQMNRLVPWRQLAPDLTVWVTLGGGGRTPAAVVDRIVARIVDDGLDPTGLGIELPGSLVGSDPDLAADLGRRLADAGVRLAIDDVGSDVLDPRALPRVPASVWKLPSELFRSERFDEDARRTAAAIIGMARALGIRTAVKGISTVEQLEELAELGADLAQGSVVGEPVPVAMVDVLLAARRERAGIDVPPEWDDGVPERIG